jgi:micrococcal nuclease
MKKTDKKKKEIRILIILVVLLLIINYTFLDDALTKFLDETKIVHVDRVIDGDTIESNGTSIRLLGINTPERGEYLYEEAKAFLENLTLKQYVVLEFTKDKTDKYNRTLAYIFINNTNVNELLVEKGYANYYFYSGKDKYSNSLEDAWETCMKNQVNLCEPSDNICADCIKIEDAKHIKNSCDSSCNLKGWSIKGEGREKFAFNETLAPTQELEFSLSLENTDGSLYLRDAEGKLVEYKSS